MKLGILFYLSVLIGICNAQEKKVFLTRRLTPIFSFTKYWETECENQFVPPAPDGKIYKYADTYSIMGGDYADNQCQFTIGIDKESGNQVYIAPYRGDSVYVMASAHFTGNSMAIPNVPFYIEACGHEYKAIFDTDGINKVTIEPYNGKYINTYIILYNDRVPDSSFALANGKKAFFADYLHKHKYIYIMTWDTSRFSNEELDTLRMITKKYAKILTNVIIVLPLANLLKKRERIKEWVIVNPYYVDFPYKQLQFNFIPNGALFDENGNIVNRGVLPSGLRSVLERLENKK